MRAPDQKGELRMTPISDGPKEDHSARIERAVRNYSKLEGMRKAFQTNVESQDANKAKIEGFEERRDRARETRRRALADDSLFAQAISRLRGNGIRVVVADTGEEARRVVLEEIGDEKLVVKSKSNVTKEIGLTPYLESKGIEVIETDAGDRIVQIAKERTVHPTGPALHLTRYDIARILSNHFGRKIEPDPDRLTEAIRNEVSSYISKASVGITGANFISAEEGAVVIVHNEGNITACARRPKKHIIVSAREKIVPNLDEAMNLAKLQILYGTGSLNSSYIDVVSAPSRTADIEKKMFYGMHGPKEVVLVLVDNGRSSIVDKEVMYCINCGSCLLKCPVYDVMGTEFGGHAYQGGRGACYAAELEGIEEGLDGGLTYCTNCGLCTEMCPVKIDTPRLMKEARRKGIEAGLLPTRGQAEMNGNLRAAGNPWGESAEERSRWADGLGIPKKGRVLYFAGCFPSLRSSAVPKAAIEVLRAGGLDVAYLGPEEGCCGSPVLKMGDIETFKELAKGNLKRIKGAGAEKVITGCAGCFNMLSSYRQYLPHSDLKVEHLSKTIADLVRDGKIKLRRSDVSITYHDPCDLGRHQGVYDEPRSVLKAIPGADLREMRFNRERSICCGAGAGVKKTHPELARFIAGRRIDAALDTGAGLLVSACAFCEENFRDAMESSPRRIEVVDLAVLVRDLMEK